MRSAPVLAVTSLLMVVVAMLLLVLAVQNVAAQNTTEVTTPPTTTATTSAMKPPKAPFVMVPTTRFVATFAGAGALAGTSRFASNVTDWASASFLVFSVRTVSQETTTTASGAPATRAEFVFESTSVDPYLAAHISRKFAGLSPSQQYQLFSILEVCAQAPTAAEKAAMTTTVAPGGMPGGGGGGPPSGALPEKFGNMTFCATPSGWLDNREQAVAVAVILIVIVIAVCICCYCMLRDKKDGAEGGENGGGARGAPGTRPGDMTRTNVDPAAAAGGGRQTQYFQGANGAAVYAPPPGLGDDPYNVDVGVRFSDDEPGTEMVNETFDADAARARASTRTAGAVELGGSRW
jgi:hypothetical protein